MRNLPAPALPRGILPVRSSAVPTPTFWQRRIVAPLAAQLTQGITPEKISLSLALGSLCAFFPILGAATPLCLLVGAVFRLNQPVIQVVNAVTAPLYPFAVFGMIRLGALLLGAPLAGHDPAALAGAFRSDPVAGLRRLAPLAGHALVGWALLAPAWVAAVHFLLVPVLRALAARRLRAPVPRP
jgi:uncharacterized protein (DUF2062 family)